MSNEAKFAILIVDDEPSVLLTYRLILEKKGYAVRTAETSTDALRLLSACKFDLLLCDYSLEQEHTGFEVIQAARIDDPLVSAVLLTGYASIETVERANRDNVIVLFKPIDIEEFFRTVESLRTRTKRGKDAEEDQHQSQGQEQHTEKNQGQPRQGERRKTDEDEGESKETQPSQPVGEINPGKENCEAQPGAKKRAAANRAGKH